MEKSVKNEQKLISFQKQVKELKIGEKDQLLASELSKWISIKAGKLNISSSSSDSEVDLENLGKESEFLKEQFHQETEVKKIICLLSKLFSSSKEEESKENH